MIRPARITDLPALVELENRCFPSDRLTVRQFRYMLTRPRSASLICLVPEPGKDRGTEAAMTPITAAKKPRRNAARDGDYQPLAGYSLLLFHPRSPSRARLYSFAVDPQQRRKGLAGQLLAASEEIARERHCKYLRLEVRSDNHAAIQFYLRHGFRQFATYDDYYIDHASALRLEKSLVPEIPGQGE